MTDRERIIHRVIKYHREQGITVPTHATVTEAICLYGKYGSIRRKKSRALWLKRYGNKSCEYLTSPAGPLLVTHVTEIVNPKLAAIRAEAKRKKYGKKRTRKPSNKPVVSKAGIAAAICWENAVEI
jgi:hypothetical protein